MGGRGESPGQPLGRCLSLLPSGFRSLSSPAHQQQPLHTTLARAESTVCKGHEDGQFPVKPQQQPRRKGPAGVTPVGAAGGQASLPPHSRDWIIKNRHCQGLTKEKSILLNPDLLTIHRASYTVLCGGSSLPPTPSSVSPLPTPNHDL